MVLDRIAYAAAGAFVLVVTWNGFRLGGGALSNGFLLIAFAAAMGHAMVARRPFPLPPWLLAATAGLVIAAMLNMIFPPDSGWINKTLLSYRTDFTPPVTDFLAPRSDLLALGKLFVGLLLLAVIFLAVARTASRVKRLMDLFVVSATANAAVALIDYAGVPISPRGSRVGREAGLTVHPNYLALTCTIAIPLALYWFSRGGRWRNAGLVATALLLGGAYVSGSRAGGVSAALAVVVTVAAIPNLRRALGVVLPVTGMVIVAMLMFTNAGNQLLEQLRFTGDPTTTGSDNARTELAELAVDQFSARPLQGVGFQVIQDAHSIYLQLLAAGGVIALAAFLTYLWGLWVSTRRARAGPERDLATAAAIGVAMWLVNGVVDSQLADKYLYVVPGLLVALSYSATALRAAPELRPHAAVSATGPTAPSLAGALPVSSAQHDRGAGSGRSGSDDQRNRGERVSGEEEPETGFVRVRR